MQIIKKLISIEITSKGIFGIVNNKEFHFEDITDFIDSKYAKHHIIATLSRDVIFVRKITLPLDVKENLDEAINYMQDELFPPVEDFLLKTYITSESEESITILVFAIPRSIYFELLKLKHLGLLTITTFLYPLLNKEKIIRKIGDWYEEAIFRDGKLQDTFLKKEIREESEIIEDLFLGAKLLAQATSQNFTPELNIYYKAPTSKKKFIPIILLIILTAYNIILSVNILQEKKKLKLIELKIKETSPIIDKYYQLSEELEKRQKLIDIISSNKSQALKYLYYVSLALPKDTWIYKFEFKFPREVRISGYTRSLTNLLISLNKSGYFEEVKVISSSKAPQNQEQFNILLKFKSIVK